VPAKASEGVELLLTLNLPLPDGTSRELKVKTVVPPGKKAGDVMELNIDPSMLHEGVLDDGNTSLFPEALPQSSTVHSLTSERTKLAKAAQARGIISKSLSLQGKQCCFNWCSCCCVGFAILLCWAFSFTEPARVTGRRGDCDKGDYFLVNPLLLCSDEDLARWTVGDEDKFSWCVVLTNMIYCIFLIRHDAHRLFASGHRVKINDKPSSSKMTRLQSLRLSR
jgi:hypothetical protein